MMHSNTNSKSSPSRALLGRELGLFLKEAPAALLMAVPLELLFRQISLWKQQGKAILYAGHNAAELEAVCDRLVLLGDGESRILERSEIPDFEALLSRWISNA